jgi:hypothetical protein
MALSATCELLVRGHAAEQRRVAVVVAGGALAVAATVCARKRSVRRARPRRSTWIVTGVVQLAGGLQHDGRREGERVLTAPPGGRPTRLLTAVMSAVAFCASRGLPAPRCGLCRVKDLRPAAALQSPSAGSVPARQRPNLE